MKAERWQQIEELYYAALECEQEERAIFLAEACGGDDALRQEVESLLRFDQRAERFIEAPALEVAAQLRAEERAQSWIGRQLGPYLILSLLGAGGMGEVYRARDTRLDREVAVKVLPAHLAQDPEALSRFEREAKAVAALSHPNILAIHDFGTDRGVRYAVMELLEGETLRSQLGRGALSWREAVEVGVAIAEGFQAAHAKGIIHRDLKPENVMLRNDRLVKVLDFGLAKLSGVRGGSQPGAAESLNTRSGVVMGTVSYTSPEQARGEKVDHRTDIFSLGVMVYEMLAGRRLFEGDTASDVMAAVLRSGPVSLGELVPEVPGSLMRIVERCMEKRPGQRFQSAGDLGFALGELSTLSGSRPESQLDKQAALPAVVGDVGSSSVRKRERLAWVVAAALFLGMLAFAWAHFIRQPMTNDARVMRFPLLLPEKSSFGHIAVSPDGRHLAFTAATGGNVQLWVRPLDSTEAKALAGTQGAIFHFWSPDSRFIGFFADGRLKKIEVSGGLVQTLCDVPASFAGAWSRDGVILFGQAGVGLSKIAATGGEVTPVTTLDTSRREVAHGAPTFLPDGRHFLYHIRSGQKEARGIHLGSLDGTLKRRLLDDDTVTKYMAAIPGEAASGEGWLLFGRNEALLAQPFDTSRMEFTGEPFSLSDKVGSDPVAVGYFTFSVSDNGVLVFDPSLRRQRRQFVWVNRRGQPINSLDIIPGGFQHWLSPDEKRFIADRLDPQIGTLALWLYDVSGSNPARFTFDPAADYSPVWSPDNRRIVWASHRDGIANLYQKAASGAGEETLLLKSDYGKIPTDWSRDSRFIIYTQTDPKTKGDVWVLPVTGSGEARPFPVVQTEANEGRATLSPDGRWLAFASDVSGRFEVYVQSFPGGGGKRQVSTGGGNHPRWRRDGRELFYYAGDGKLMAVPVRSGESFDAGAAIALFEFRAGTFLATYAPYAVTTDGQRFLINAVVETEPNAPLTVVVNWPAEAPK